METSFLDYYKTILEKVSFSQELLAREYHKALKILTRTEQDALKHWVKEKGIKPLRFKNMNPVLKNY